MPPLEGHPGVSYIPPEESGQEENQTLMTEFAASRGEMMLIIATSNQDPLNKWQMFAPCEPATSNANALAQANNYIDSAILNGILPNGVACDVKRMPLQPSE